MTCNAGNPALPEQHFDSPNRRDCLAKLEEICRAAGRGGQGAVLKIYLENFKSFNDIFGYAQGGLLLRDIAFFLCGLPGADVYRYAGVEFLVFLDGASPADTLLRAQDIADRFENTWRIGELEVMCAADMGVRFYPDRAQTPQELLAQLDAAVAHSARQGQNRFTLWDAELQDKLYRRTIIAKLLRSAVAGDDIEIRYRPVFCAGQNHYTRAECGLRLLTVEFGPVGSAEFLPIAEETGIICTVNHYVLQKTCAFIRELLDDGIEFESIAAPISPVQFLQERFVRDVAQLLEEYRIPRGRLAFEIAENPLLTSFRRAQRALAALAGMGVEIVLCGFGAGHLSVNSLLDLPVHVLKLDRQFIRQLETNLRSEHVLRGLIQVARGLDLKIIAEGVESENQISLLNRYGCDYRQGFYYAPAVGAAELRDLLRN